MMIDHYPQGWGEQFDQDRTRERRRADDRRYKDGVLPRERAVPGRKDTKRWCRGKVGVEHQAHWVKLFDLRTKRQVGAWWQWVCSQCGKKMQWQFRPEVDDGQAR